MKRTRERARHVLTVLASVLAGFVVGMTLHHLSPPPPPPPPLITTRHHQNAPSSSSLSLSPSSSSSSSLSFSPYSSLNPYPSSSSSSSSLPYSSSLPSSFLSSSVLSSLLTPPPPSPPPPSPPPPPRPQQQQQQQQQHSTTTSTTTTSTSTTSTTTITTKHQPRMCYSSVAHRLQAEVRVLCLVVTYPAQHTSRALPVHLTWARRCSQVIFVTNNATNEVTEGNEQATGEQEGGAAGQVQEEEDQVLGEEEKKRRRRRKEEEEDAVKSLPFLVVPEAEEGKSGLWRKTKFAFSHAHRHHLEDFDWFLKADDDTYVIMENLRYWLHDKDPDQSHYYGCHFTPYAPKGYMSGGAGYVLSRGALREFQKQVEDDDNNNNSNNNNYNNNNSDNNNNNNYTYNNYNYNNTTYAEEDVEMGVVLARAGVYPGDARDREGRPLFFPLYPSFLLGAKEQDFWYWQILAHDHSTGLECCSKHTVSFHYVYGDLLYELEFLIYHLKLFGTEEAPGQC